MMTSASYYITSWYNYPAIADYVSLHLTVLLATGHTSMCLVPTLTMVNRIQHKLIYFHRVHKTNK